jgi:hypothetical protein
MVIILINTHAHAELIKADLSSFNRVEAWRAKKKREQDVQDAQKRVQEIRKNKAWSLEDDEEDDEADNVIDEVTMAFSFVC